MSRRSQAIDRPGLFACGLVPALLTLLIRAWVPESPRWLVRMGRPGEARRSLAWALQVSPASPPLPKLDERRDRQLGATCSAIRAAYSCPGSAIPACRRRVMGSLPWHRRRSSCCSACPFLSVHICEFGGVRRALCLLRAFRADRLRIAPRETSGTDGSNPSSSSEESSAKPRNFAQPVQSPGEGRLLRRRETP